MALVTKSQLWMGVILAGLMFAFLVYGVFSGFSDRAIIKERIDQLLQNLSQIDSQQTQTIEKIEAGQSQAEQQRQNQTAVLLPALQKSFTQTNAIENNTNETRALTSFLSDNFGAESDYLERENFQYQQANATFIIINETKHLLSQGLDIQQDMIQNQEEIKTLLNNSK